MKGSSLAVNSAASTVSRRWRGSLLIVPVILGSALTACAESPTGPSERPEPPPSPPEAVSAQLAACRNGFAFGYPCSGVDLVARRESMNLGRHENVGLNDVWGWTDLETGVEYALVGRYDGLSIVDLSTPAEPRTAAFLPTHTSTSVWRDMKVYADHVYVVSEARGHGMQVLDLTRLRGLTEYTELEADANYTRISAAHNIAINEETGFAYVVGSNGGADTCGGGLHMIDLSDPKSPTFAGCYAEAGTGRRGTGYTHDVQCVVYRGPDAEYAGREICVASNETAIVVSDVTDKANPITLSTARYAATGYVHQGWFDEGQQYFYQNDELDEQQFGIRTRLLVWDLEDLDDPVLAKRHSGPTGAVDHNLYVHGDLIYHSNYTFGVRILDISDPANPRERGFFDTAPLVNDRSTNGSWSVYPYFESGLFVATSRNEGFFVLRLQ